MIKLVEIQKIYQGIAGGQHVLKDINLQFKRNEFVAILGKSGCGKTTLLNIIGGLDKPSSGEMAINSKLSSKMNEGEWDEFRNHKIGFVFQNFNLIDHLNVLDNVIVALKISGDKINQKERAIDVLTKVGLKDHIYKKVNQLSGGQRQRVAIARALINNPEIILADEPTGSLDKKTSNEVMDLIKELSKDKLVIFVTHNKNIANKYANRIIEMSDGRVISDSNPIDERVTVDLGIKINRNKLGFKDSILYAFKSGFKNRWKTILTALGLAIGIMAIMLIDGIFTSSKNAIDPDTKNEYNRLLIASSEYNDNMIDDINTFPEFEDSFEIKKNYYIIEKLNGEMIATQDYRLQLRNDLLAVPDNNVQYNEYESNLLYGSMPKNSGEIALSYSVASILYKFELTEDNIKNRIINDTVDILDTNVANYNEEDLINYINDNDLTYYYYDYIDEFGKIYKDGNLVFNDEYEESVAYAIYKELYLPLNIEPKIGGEKVLVIDYNIDSIITSYDYSYKNFKIVGVMEGNDYSGIVPGMYYNYDFSFMLKEDIESFSDDLTFLENMCYTYIKDDKISEKADIIKRFQNDFGYSLYNVNVANSSSLSTFVLSLLQFVFTAISSVTLITGAIMLWLLLYVSTVQRKREIGLLRSMGATKNDICSIFVSETLIIGLLACILASILLVIITPITNYIIPNHYYSYVKDNISFMNPKKPIEIRISKMIWISVFGIFIAFFAGLIPSIRASKKTPIESLRGE